MKKKIIIGDSFWPVLGRGNGGGDVFFLSDNRLVSVDWGVGTVAGSDAEGDLTKKTVA